MLAYIFPDFLYLLRGELDGAVVILDCFLDVSDGEVPGAAARASCLVAEAAEVLIYPAVSSVASVYEPAAAVVAEDRALEVVEVLLGAVAGVTVSVEDLLHLLEGVSVDDRGVASLALDAFAGNDPDVVIIAQEAVHAVAAQRFGCSLGGCTRA